MSKNEETETPVAPPYQDEPYCHYDDPPRSTFRADRPLYFLLVKRSTGLITFMGLEHLGLEGLPPRDWDFDGLYKRAPRLSWLTLDAPGTAGRRRALPTRQLHQSDRSAAVGAPDAAEAGRPRERALRRVQRRVVRRAVEARPELAAVRPDGKRFDFVAQDCPVPGLPAPFLCSYSASPANPAVDTIDIEVSFGGRVVTREVPLREFNYCARDVAYVPAMVDGTGQVRFGETQYISPCRLPR